MIPTNSPTHRPTDPPNQICERIVDLNDIELMFDDFKHEHDR